MGRRLYADLETDGLLADLTTLHILTAADIDTGEMLYFGPPVPLDFDWMGKDPSPSDRQLLANPSGCVVDGVNLLCKADFTLFHNGVGFDHRALAKLYPWWREAPRAWDTLILAKCIWPYDNLIGPDLERMRKGLLPAKHFKRHTLEAWGYRLGEFKDEYTGDLRIEDPKERAARKWEAWNPWMASYGIQDIRPMQKLWPLIEQRMGWVDLKPGDIAWPIEAVEMEHEVARILAEQEAFGVRFDVAGAQRLDAELTNELARIERALKETFGSWWQKGEVVYPARAYARSMSELPDVTVKRFSEKTGKELKPYVGPPKEHFDPEAPFTPVRWIDYRPSSRQHLGMRLQDVFGWKPKKFGKDKKDGTRGDPSVDESVLEEIPEAVIPPETRRLILDFFIVNKVLGMLSNGNKAWMRLVTPQGRIHGRVDPLGAITGRGAHSNPNLGQCFAVRKEKVKQPDGTTREEVLMGLAGRYGAECRALFVADTTEDGHDEDWEQTGVDASALELIDLGHYLQPHDGGKFSERVCDPKRDPHTEHAELTGLTRGDTKTATYLYVYGGSAYKLSLDLSITAAEIPEHIGYKGLPMLLKSLERRFDADFVAKLDDAQKAKIAKARKIILAFEGGIEGIKDLKDGVGAAAKARGWLKGMDGRKLIVRKAHAALNTLLQSAGAQSCKLWMVLTHQKLKALGLTSGVDFKQVLWVHDELQFTHRPGLGPTIKAVAEEAMREAGEKLGLRGVYRTDGKTGANWFECH